MAICKATRNDGSSCRAQAATGGEVCFWYDPDSRGKMIEAAQRGGARRAVELREGESLTPERARAILAGVIEAAASGAMDSGTFYAGFSRCLPLLRQPLSASALAALRGMLSPETEFRRLRLVHHRGHAEHMEVRIRLGHQQEATARSIGARVTLLRAPLSSPKFARGGASLNAVHWEGRTNSQVSAASDQCYPGDAPCVITSTSISPRFGGPYPMAFSLRHR